MALYGVIDIGSNSLISSLIEVENGNTKILKEEVTEMGADWSLVEGKIPDKSVQSLWKALDQFQSFTYRMGVGKVLVAGTSLFREAENGPEIMAQIQAKYAWKSQILTGVEEGGLAKLALQNFYHREELVLVDLGSRSTEIAFHNQVHSIEIGAKRLHLEGQGFSNKKLRNLVKKYIPQIKKVPNHEAWFWVGGTATALGMIHMKEKVFRREGIEGLYLEANQVLEWVEKLEVFSLEEKVHMTGLSFSRCQILVPGLFIMEALIHKYKIPAVRLSTLGFRHGMLFQHLAN